MAKIIVSYRRSDSDATAGRIRDRLASHFGEGSLFMDVDNIPFGTDFRDRLDGKLAGSHAVVAVVGPRWTGPVADGRLRIKGETDPVRIEIEAALHKGIPVIPVLVDGGRMPAPSDLPEALRDFAYLDAIPIEAGPDFQAQIDRLIQKLDRIGSTAAAKAVPPAASGNRKLAMILAGGLGSIAIVLAVVFFALRERPEEVSTGTPAEPAPASECSSTAAAAPLDEASVPPAGAALRNAIRNGVSNYFRCGSAPFDQLARAYASISIVIPEYVADARCFSGDPRFLTGRWNDHKGWADQQDRRDTLLPALDKAINAALDCIAAAQQPMFYQDVARALTVGMSPLRAYTFADPKLMGKHIDRCLVSGKQCDEPAGFAWCSRFGFDRMLKWEWIYQTPTYTLGDRQTCTSKCGGFSTITCAR